jgi:predicted flap endonuclease-1-like 5' DNA nuclease
MASIDTIEGIGPAYAKKLKASGVRSCEALLKRGATKKGRNELAEATGFDAKTLLEWVNRADLMRVKGVGSEYSDLLEAAGVDTVKELRNRNAKNLTAKMAEVNEAAIKKTKKSIVRRVPAESMVERWVAHAKKLPPVVTH